MHDLIEKIVECFIIEENQHVFNEGIIGVSVDDVSNATQKVGVRIRQVRKSKGLSTTKLEELSGVTEGHINKIERGVRSPTVATLEKLAEALEVPLVVFFTFI